MWKKIKIVAVSGWALGLAVAGHALTLELPAPLLGEKTRSKVPGSYAVPIGPFADGVVPFRTVEGAVDQRAFRLDAPDRTTLAIFAPLRDQVLASGFEVLLDCEARVCGGFDFRYAAEVLPEPDMHVDLADFRFLSAVRGDEAVTILVSRSALSAYVQVTRVTAASAAAVADVEPLPVIDLEVNVSRGLDEAPLAAGGIVEALDGIGTAVLDDLVFASGAATLAEGDYPSLVAIAAWLAANPDGTVALVGHTDASGSLAANVALSERRAEAVAEVLIDRHGADRVRVSAKGVGFLSPRASNQTEEGRQRNRRVEVVVTSTR